MPENTEAPHPLDRHLEKIARELDGIERRLDDLLEVIASGAALIAETLKLRL